jgi:hypothetical protein
VEQGTSRYGRQHSLVYTISALLSLAPSCLKLTGRAQKPSPCCPLAQPFVLQRPAPQLWGSTLEHSHPNRMALCNRPDVSSVIVVPSFVYPTYGDKLLNYGLEIFDCRKHERIDAHLALPYGTVSSMILRHTSQILTGFFHLVSQSCLKLS